MNISKHTDTSVLSDNPYLAADEQGADISDARGWQDAVCVCVDYALVLDRCFSSGEIAKYLREERADFRFGVTEIGEFVKDLFHSGAIEYSDAEGESWAAVQVPRRTEGGSRTPANTEVFVYAPSVAAGKVHEFEVEIPRPGFTPTALELQRFAVASAQANAEMVASVHADGRLCIPRRAFESLSHATQVAIRGGDRVWVEILDGGAGLRIYLGQRDGCSEHDLSQDRGRVRFSAPDSRVSFVQGARHPIVVEAGGLTIRLDVQA